MTFLAALLRFLALRLELIADRITGHDRRPVATELAVTPTPSILPQCNACGTRLEPEAWRTVLTDPEKVVATTCAACWVSIVPEIVHVILRAAERARAAREGASA